MFFKNFHNLVFWTKVASALEGLKFDLKFSKRLVLYDALSESRLLMRSRAMRQAKMVRIIFCLTSTMSSGRA